MKYELGQPFSADIPQGVKLEKIDYDIPPPEKNLYELNCMGTYKQKNDDRRVFLQENKEVI